VWGGPGRTRSLRSHRPPLSLSRFALRAQLRSVAHPRPHRVSDSRLAAGAHLSVPSRLPAWVLRSGVGRVLGSARVRAGLRPAGLRPSALRPAAVSLRSDIGGRAPGSQPARFRGHRSLALARSLAARARRAGRRHASPGPNTGLLVIPPPWTAAGPGGGGPPPPRLRARRGVVAPFRVGYAGRRVPRLWLRGDPRGSAPLHCANTLATPAARPVSLRYGPHGPRRCTGSGGRNGSLGTRAWGGLQGPYDPSRCRPESEPMPGWFTGVVAV
jgi:hypothetical protein